MISGWAIARRMTGNMASSDREPQLSSQKRLIATRSGDFASIVRHCSASSSMFRASRRLSLLEGFERKMMPSCAKMAFISAVVGLRGCPLSSSTMKSG